MIRTKKARRERVSQGDIFRDVEFIEHFLEQEGNIQVSKIVFPYVIVLTQDCDLEQDYKFRWSRQRTHTQDKWLLSVLVAPLYNVDHVKKGEHLTELDMKMAPIGSRTELNHLHQNRLPRYHYLEFPKATQLVSSVIDFKHYFSVNVKYLRQIRNTNFVCRVSELYREDISHRFAAFLSRIGLPSDIVHSNSRTVNNQ